MDKNKKRFILEAQANQPSVQTNQNTNAQTVDPYASILSTIQIDCNDRFKGENLRLNGTTVTFTLRDDDHDGQVCNCKFNISETADQEDGDSQESYRSYFTPIGYSNLGSWVVSRYCIHLGEKKLEVQFDGDSTHRCWDIYFANSQDISTLREVLRYEFKRRNEELDEPTNDQANDPANDPSNPGGNVNPGGNTNSGGGFDRRVYAMQVRLNDAGYTDNNNNPLEEDGLLGPKTRAAAQKAGIDPETWNGTPRLTPASAGASGGAGGTTTTPETFENNKAYGRFLGGADKAEIFAFQKKFGVEQTGIYDEATAEKAYELALDAQSEFTQAGRTIKAWAEKYGSYSSGDQAGYQRAQSEFKTQQMAQAVETSLSSLNAALDAYMKGNPAANKRIMYIKQQIAKADFEDAKAKAGVLAQKSKGNQIIQLIDAYEKAYMAQQASRQQAVNEIKTNFFSMLERINNATILM